MHTKAAESLHISQPALSIMISHLQKEIGCPLFDKRGRNIVLNKQGQIFYDYISRGLYMIERAQQEVSNSFQVDQQTIIVHATALTLLHNFSTHSAIVKVPYNVNVIPIRVNEIQASLSNTSVDFVLSSVPFTTKNMKMFPLGEEQLFVALHKEHPLASSSQLSLEVLRNEPFILPASNTGIHANICNLFESAGIRPNVIFECDLDLRMTLVALNKGITLISESGIIWKKYSKDICSIPLQGNPTRKICLLCNTDRILSEKDQLFIHNIASYYHDVLTEFRSSHAR